MATEAQVVANRRNAEKSTGPRTAEGKAAVSQNAIKHGLLACRDVIRGEEQEEFDLYREELFWELEPVGTMESRLAERIVSLSWRLRRAERIQNEAFDVLLTKASPLARLTQSLRSKGADQPPDDSDGCDGDPALGRTVVRDFSSARVLDRLLMYERRIESSLYRTMAELRKLRRAEKLDACDMGIGCRTRRDAKEDTRIQASGGHSPPYESGEASPGEGRPDGVATSAGGSAKQSQSPAADGGVCSVPMRASLETQDIASLQSDATSASNCAKQSQSPPVDGVHGTPYESGDTGPGEGTPYGVTASVGDSAKQGQSMADGDVCSVRARASLETQDVAPLQCSNCGRRSPSIRDAPLVAAEGHAKEIRVSPA